MKPIDRDEAFAKQRRERLRLHQQLSYRERLSWLEQAQEFAVKALGKARVLANGSRGDDAGKE